MHQPIARVRRRRTLAVAVTAALALAACGGDDDSSAETTAATTAEVATTSADVATTADDTGDTTVAAGELLPDRDTLSFGALWETPPMIGVDASDTTKPVGVTPDLAAAMAPLLGVEVEWQNLQWPAQLPGVQSGVVDALFGQVTITEERELSVVDLIPFFKTTLALLVPEGNPNELTKLADACGLTIGVPVGSIQSELIAEINASACQPGGKDDITAAEYQGATAAVSAIMAGTIDGWMDNQTSINQAADSGAGSFAVVPVPEDEYPADFTGIAVGKDQPEVTTALAEALKALIEDGTYGEIMASYGLEDSAITADEVVVNPFTGTEVGVVATAG